MDEQRSLGDDHAGEHGGRFGARGIELLHYLDVSWQSIIAGDIDGPESIPYKIDQSAPNLNRCSATRRVARAIFMGTAPTHQQENRGLDDKQINLGVVQPGEKPAVFGDALRRLGNRARFMHGDLGRYWYSMSASLNRVAADRATCSLLLPRPYPSEDDFLVKVNSCT